MQHLSSNFFPNYVLKIVSGYIMYYEIGVYVFVWLGALRIVF